MQGAGSLVSLHSHNIPGEAVGTASMLVLGGRKLRPGEIKELPKGTELVSGQQGFELRSPCPGLGAHTPPALWILPGTVAPIPSVFAVCLLDGGCGKEETDWTLLCVQDLLPNFSSPPNPRVTGRIFSSLEPPMLGLAIGPFAKSQGSCLVGWWRRAWEREFTFLMRKAGEISEQLQSPAAGHTHGPALGRGAAQDRGGCPDAPRLRNPDLREGKCKSAPPSVLPAEGGFSVCAPGFLCPQPEC